MKSSLLTSLSGDCYASVKITVCLLVTTASFIGSSAQQEFNLGRALSGTASNPASSLESLSVDPQTIPLLQNYSAVTDETLQNPPDSDWLIWRSTYASQGHSQLTEINTNNVENLQLAWRQQITPGNNMPTPLVHDGVMFLYSAGDVVLALDATNGQLLWRYRHQGGEVTSQKFGLALHGNKVLMPTSDGHIVALDARSGNVIWDHTIDTQGVTGYVLRSAPLVASGQVIQGVIGSRVPGGGFIVAVDLESGTETWRFNTIARPDEVGGNTWNNIPLAERQGGSVWIPGSYDPELDLVFFGASPTYNTAPLLYPIGIEGVNNAALYTNSTLALRPATGELVWHYQHMANDQFDHDWIFERTILEMDVAGESRKLILTAGKPALFDAMDAATGKYLFSFDTGIQNIVGQIDPDTGFKHINPGIYPDTESTRLVCPMYQGGRNWPATSTNEEAGLLFVPLFEVCMNTRLTGETGLLSSGLRMDPAPLPGSDGNFGSLQAIDLASREMLWQYRQQMPPSSAALSTKGGLVFAGFMDRSFKAFDQRTGKQLWQTQLDAIPASFPITYSVGNKQYVAVVSGQLNMHTGIWLGILAQFTGHVEHDPGLPAIWVFAL
ncbi:MAG: PQQ-binding-like beta-propeller repeat protein [Pseudomonadales bacterium]|nr:PQQ-binding-like beta-propeller repeat protein [Pseudomonadales bacterium]